MIDLPTFSVTGMTITHRNPKIITDGIVLCHEAYIEIDATKMSQEFLQRLMWHMGEGNVRVRVAEKAVDV